MEVSNDAGGQLSITIADEGSVFRTNNKTFGEIGKPRVEARYRAAIKQLEAQGYIEDRSGKGAFFRITDDGFDAADRIEKDSTGYNIRHLDADTE